RHRHHPHHGAPLRRPRPRLLSRPRLRRRRVHPARAEPVRGRYAMSPAVTSVVDRAEAHYRDLALAGVRRWKEATGGLAVGYLPIWAPREMLHAQGVLPVGLMGGGEDVEII